MRERVGEVPKRVALRTQLLLQVRAENTGLHACQARGAVDREQLVQAYEVHRDDRARLGHGGLERAGDRRAAAEGDDDGVEAHGGPQDGGDLVLAARAHDDVRDAGQLAATLTDEVAQGLAARVHDAIKRVDRDERSGDRLL